MVAIQVVAEAPDPKARGQHPGCGWREEGAELTRWPHGPVESSPTQNVCEGHLLGFIARATAGYCFSPLFGLLSASRDFAALHP